MLSTCYVLCHIMYKNGYNVFMYEDPLWSWNFQCMHYLPEVCCRPAGRGGRTKTCSGRVLCTDRESSGRCLCPVHWMSSSRVSHKHVSHLSQSSHNLSQACLAPQSVLSQSLTNMSRTLVSPLTVSHKHVSHLSHQSVTLRVSHKNVSHLSPSLLESLTNMPKLVCYSHSRLQTLSFNFMSENKKCK